jgi:hypothetical protein
MLEEEFAERAELTEDSLCDLRILRVDYADTL